MHHLQSEYINMFPETSVMPSFLSRRYEGYLTSIPPTDYEDEEDDYSSKLAGKSITAPSDVLKDFQGTGNVSI